MSDATEGTEPTPTTSSSEEAAAPEAAGAPEEAAGPEETVASGVTATPGVTAAAEGTAAPEEVEQGSRPTLASGVVVPGAPGAEQDGSAPAGPTSGGVTACPDCGALTHTDDAFCEDCGSPLGPLAGAPAEASSDRTPDEASHEVAAGERAASEPATGEVVGPAGSPTGSPAASPAEERDREPTAEVSRPSAPTAVLAPPVPAEYGSPDGGILPAAVATTYVAPVGAPAGASAVGHPGGDAAPTIAGVEVAAVRICTSCGGTIAPDGYCLECGEPAASERDHFRESPAAWLGGVCDRGVARPRNEDAMALAVHHDPDGTTTGVMVVCDGVSSAPDSDVASLAAARAAADDVLTALAEAGEPVRRGAFLARTLGTAAHAANVAVLAATPPEHDSTNPPSCTYVACAVEPGVVAVAWAGDSRAYWLPDSGTPVQLTTDHSWSSEMIALGMPRAEAEAARHAHAITRWLGADAPEGGASTAVLTPFGPGWVLACSDGLWNYCSPAQELAELVPEVCGDLVDPTERAAALVRWACEQGGRDNVTVALARVAGSGT